MAGGAFLCFEGFEKLAHKFLHSQQEQAAERDALSAAVANPQVDLLALEKDKVKGAVRTDFILSAEIIAITLGTVQGKDFSTQLIVLSSIAIVVTVGVYGLVAGIVKLDDAGLYLSQAGSNLRRSVGRGILWLAPWLMKGLSIVGTAAMFLVGGSILTHGLTPLQPVVDAITAAAGRVPSVGTALAWVTPLLLDMVVGIVTGALVLGVVLLVKKVMGKH
jgi:hypothetical protein